MIFVIKWQDNKTAAEIIISKEYQGLETERLKLKEENAILKYKINENEKILTWLETVRKENPTYYNNKIEEYKKLPPDGKKEYFKKEYLKRFPEHKELEYFK